MKQKKQQSILITGCSSGIGLHCAQRLHEKGYQVIATARNQNDVQRLQTQGLTAFRLDLDDSQSIKECLIKTLEVTHGQLDALFNNGAYGQPGAVEDLSRNVLKAQFETNLFGTFELINNVIPIMRKQGHGRIIQNSSVLGLVVLPYRGAYNASKFAMEALTDTLRLELKGSAIFISLIEPGPIESQFRKNAFDAYEKNIDTENSVHKEIYAAMERRLKKQGPAAPFTLHPEAVFKKLLHALESPKPKIRYYVTFPTYLFAALKRLLPHSALDKVLALASRSENK